jgi:hypothetical protein
MMMIVQDGRFDHIDGRSAQREGGEFTYNLEAGAFYNAPNVPEDPRLLASLRFGSQTVRTMTYVEYYRRQPSLPSAPHPWLYLCLPGSKFLEYAKRVFDTPAELAYSSPRFSVWRRNSIKRPLTRMPNEALVVRFQCSRLPPPSADMSAVLAINRTLYERARDMGGTRLRNLPQVDRLISRHLSEPLRVKTRLPANSVTDEMQVSRRSRLSGAKL